jgi:hypothetical protein
MSEMAGARWGVWNLNGKGGWCYYPVGSEHPFEGTYAEAQTACAALAAMGRSRYEVRRKA